MYWEQFLFLGVIVVILLVFINIKLFYIRDYLQVLTYYQTKKNLQAMANEIFAQEYEKFRAEAIRRAK